MARKPKDLRNPWALAFAVAIYTWLDEHGKDGTEFAISLDIPLDRWYHAVSANAITRPEYYARVYSLTGIPEADPRTIPPRRFRSGLIHRAWTEEQWQAWLANNQNQYESPTVHETMSSDTITAVSPDQVTTLLQTLTATLQNALEDEANIDDFINRHGHKLGRLYTLISICKIENPTDRNMAIKAYRRFKR